MGDEEVVAVVDDVGDQPLQSIHPKPKEKGLLELYNHHGTDRLEKTSARVSAQAQLDLGQTREQHMLHLSHLGSVHRNQLPKALIQDQICPKQRLNQSNQRLFFALK